jgi:L-ascorbate metabolism protein UlaG (beta-lactamase superfamily)
MRLTWFGHSAFRLEIPGAIVMIDPFLENATFKGDVKAAYNGATHVVLTHGHDDHIGSTVEICKATGAILVANFEVCMYLSGKGVDKYSPANHGGTVDFGAFAASYVPAWHSSSTVVDGRPVYLGNPAGVVINAKGEKTFFHMGDTDIFSDMGLINEIYQPKLAAMACKRFYTFETVVPAHYATFPIIDQTADKFVAEMKDAKTKVIVPERGVAVPL